jgi:NOL1/NOP2/sun family putative RNA methylase
LNYVSPEILNYFTALYGEASTRSYQNQINQEPSQYIRVNLSKISSEILISSLKEKYGIICEQISGYQNILKTHDTNNLLGKTLEHILGYYYIQSFSSFIPPLNLKPNPNDIVLDLCSAPGSKTTELGEIMNNKGTIVANEIQIDRLKSLVHNIDRMNQMNAGVLHFKGEQLNTIYNDYFDKILVDAPCSGLGIVQKKIEVNDWWTLERVRRLSELQLKLLVSAIKMLKVGGELVYSTCTLTVEENELIIDKILKKYPVEVQEFELLFPAHEGITFYNGEKLNPSLSKAKRILPWEVNSDGFFIIKLIKTGETEPPHKKDLKIQDIRLLDSGDKKVKVYLKNLKDDFGLDEEILSEYKYILKSNDIFFVNKNWCDSNPGSFSRIGTRFGTLNKDNKITLHTQAAQTLSNKIYRNVVDLKNSEELKIYLEGGTIKTSSPQCGQCVVKFQNHFLGTGVFTSSGLKSQFPRARRTQQIHSEF